MMRLRWSLVAAFAVLVVSGLVSGRVALAQGGIVQDEHDRRIRADTERNTKYHNNADDYPVNKPVTRSTNSGSNYVPVLNKPYKRLYEPNIETEADHTFIRAMQHYMAREDYMAAAFQLGQCYYSGIGTPVNKARAYEYWDKVAGGDVRAKFLISLMQYEGDGVLKSEALGLQGIQQAARRGSVDAAGWLAAQGYKPVLMPAKYDAADGDLARASKLLFGSGAEKNAAEGAKLVQARAAEGYPWANFYLGRMLEEGLGVAQDDGKAYWAYYEAAEVLPVAESNAGALAAAKRLTVAWWNGGDLGLRQSDEQARLFTGTPLRAGDAEVNYLVGDAYEKGTHGYKPNQVYAAEYFTVAARNGASVYGSAAEARLAELYFFGQGIEQDMTKAADHARKAAERGEGLGMLVLAYLNRAGVGGFAKDPAQSVEWMKASAAAGHLQAKSEMAKGYDGTLKGGMVKGIPISSAERAAKNAAVALPGIVDRAPGVFARAYPKGKPGYTAAEIAGMQKVWADYEKAYAIQDRKKSMKVIAALDWNKIGTLGMAYVLGDGVPVDYVHGADLLEYAANIGGKGDWEIAAWGTLLGRIVGKGEWQTNREVGKAMGDFRAMVRRAHLTPTPMSNYLMAIGTVWNPEPEVMRKYLVVAADGGIADAQIELAYQMWAGTGGPVDVAGGVKYMEMAAKTDPNAMYALGAVMANGLNGVPTDKAKAKELLTAAAGMGQGQAVKMVAGLQ